MESIFMQLLKRNHHTARSRGSRQIIQPYQTEVNHESLNSNRFAFRVNIEIIYSLEFICVHIFSFIYLFIQSINKNWLDSFLSS